MSTESTTKGNQSLLHKERVTTSSHNYFFDVRKANNGRRFLVFAQSTSNEDGSYETHSMTIFQDELLELERVFSKMVAFIMKIDDIETMANATSLGYKTKQQ